MAYLIAKSNPQTVCRADDWLRTRPLNGVWTVLKDARLGDTLFIAMSGEFAGVYARARVTGISEFRAEEPDEYWVIPEKARIERWTAEIEILDNRVSSPIFKDRLLGQPDLRGVGTWLGVRGSVRRLSSKEASELEALYA